MEFEEERIDFIPDAKLSYNETKRLILTIIDNLPVEQRICIVLYYYEDKSSKEIAEICECSENTVKSRLHYARRKIREELEREDKNYEQPLNNPKKPKKQLINL